jgi:hypothetical protein
VCKIFVLVLTAAALGAPALADSKSAAQFMLATCLAAMDNVGKVEVMARENNWTPKPLSQSPEANKFRKSRSLWDVAQGEDKFIVNIWINHLADQDLNVCFVHFLNANVNRDEFLSFIAASVQLTLFSDTRFAQIQMHSESYEIKSNHPKVLELGIQSRSDGNMMVASMRSMSS